MTEKFDMIIIGTGPAGSSIAEKCSREGKRAAIVDQRGYGGVCPLRGCIPKKVLASATNLIDQTERMRNSGITMEGGIKWKELMDFKRTFTDPVPKAKEQTLQEAGVKTYHGHAVFTGQHTVQIGKHELEGDKVVIATGAAPVNMPIEGAEHLIYSDDFLELDHLPEKLIFVGGGYISFEFAHIAARAGSKVEIIQRSEQALKAFDHDLVEQLVKRTEEIGINVHLNTAVKQVEKTESGFMVKADKHGEEVTFTGELVIHGAGRVPQVEGLNLEKANVEYKKSGVQVNSYLQSNSNPDVYAVGDAADTSGAPLTPVGALEADTVIKNLLSGNQSKADYTGVPSVVFTTPKLAMAGMSEQQARESERSINVKHQDISNFFTYKHTNETAAAVKVITDKDSDTIIGAHMLSDQADELINYFAMAIQLGLKTEQLKNITYVFPTAVSDVPSML